MDGAFTSWLITGLYALFDITAFILAVIYFRRCSAAFTLVIIAVLGNLAVVVVRDVLLQAWDPAVENWRLQSLILKGTWVASCVTYGLMILAIFVGRIQSPAKVEPMPTGDDRRRPSGVPPATKSTGIEERKF